MGVKHLWTILTPYSEKKSIHEIRGKTLAIDLAGWVCDSLNVVEYCVHPKQHLKNLFYRTICLLWQEVTPIFVLEGDAPNLKNMIISKRNIVKFCGTAPKTKYFIPSSHHKITRTRFDAILRQCEILLNSMGIVCIKGPGEAEAYCAFLNKKGLVDGVISQDSDCFAYGAQTVYRNFSISTPKTSSKCGSIEIYDIQNISKFMDFGQNKVIVMALMCGCDYCPEGIGGIGLESVLRLFNNHNEHEILDRVKSWRHENKKFTELEILVNNKLVCVYCGHLGSLRNHAKRGCGICCTKTGCDESLWKEKRLALKSELVLRRKALSVSTFPSEEIIKEFLSEPDSLPNIELNWNQPNIVKFIRKVANLLQWSEIYAFQKFFPILTRWQVRNYKNIQNTPGVIYLVPKKIVRKRTLRGISSLEVLWIDKLNLFNGLIPDDQLKDVIKSNSRGLQALWTTIEPVNLMEEAYSDLVKSFFSSNQKNELINLESERKNDIKVHIENEYCIKPCSPSIDLIKAKLIDNSSISKLLLDLEYSYNNEGYLNISNILNKILNRNKITNVFTMRKGASLK